jgi:hypothetical protein
MDIKFLNYPLYSLYYLDDVTQFTGLSEKAIAALTSHKENIVAGIKEAILWAVQHPEFDYMAFDDDLRHSNQDIHDYLRKVAKSLGLV